jgi:hypothetical protein
MGNRGITLLVAALVAVCFTPGPTAAAAAEPTCQSDVPVVGDVDGDSLSDLVVGLPDRTDGGAVDLRLSTAPSRILTGALAGFSPSVAGDEFGSAIGLADLDGDNCDDLVIGAPGTGVNAGSVDIVFGAPDGFKTTGGLTVDGGSAPEDRFGSAVAIAANLGLPGFDLWVGAPYDNPGGVVNAGSVSHFIITSPGGIVTTTLVETISQDTPGVPGAAEPNDHFGAVLSATSQGVLVGDPDEDVGSAKDAGAVTFLATNDSDAGFDGATSWSQASPKVAGGAEAGDHFGAALNTYFGLAIVGAPGEDVGRVKDAGMVQTFASPSLADPPVPVKGITQNSPGIPGVAEAGDRLGSSVVIGRNLGCFDSVRQAAIGAPGEDITVHGSSRHDAGTVLVITLTTGGHCSDRNDDQQSVLDGTAEAGDQLGSALALGRFRDDNDDEQGDRAFIAVPSEDRGTVKNAGIIESTAVGSGANSNDLRVAGDLTPSVGYSGGAVAGMRYGDVLAAPAGD